MKNVFSTAMLILALLLPAGLCARSSQKSPSLNNLRLNGLMTYDTNKDGKIFGHYSYSVKNPSDRKLLVAMPFVTANGGAIYRDGKFYLYNYDVQFGYVMSASYTVYDAATGTLLNTKDMKQESAHAVYMNAATTVAASPVSADVYACSFSYDASSNTLGYVLSKWNLENLTKDSIAPLERGMRAMAVAPDGTLYGITMKTQNGTDAGGVLVKIDTQTGKLTPIGNTGIAPDYFQSATIDKNTGILYWFSVNVEQKTILYTIDLSTGVATSVGELPFADQVIAAYVPEPAAPDGAPSPVLNLVSSFPDGSLKGNVSFDVPKETYDGLPLSGDLTYQVIANGVIAAEGTTVAGTHVDVPVAVKENGQYKIEVVLFNAIGKSPATDVHQYIGQDTPLSVTGLVVSRENNINTVKWYAPKGTVNGGYMNPSNVTYDVVRLPDSTVVASMLKDTIVTDAYVTEFLSTCKYAVTPSNENLVGQTAVSNAVKVGEYVPLPYSEDFSDATTFDMFTVLNSNEDANTWSYYKGTARYRSSFKLNADDWLIVAPVKLVKGLSYNLSYDVSGSSSRYIQKLTVMMGNAATAEGMVIPLKSLTEYTNSTPMRESLTIEPEVDGIYYIGFHVTSASSQGNLSIDNISISAGTSGEVPAAVVNLVATPAPKGELQASVSFTSPSLNADGKPLTELTKFEILRNGKVVGMIEAVSVQMQDYTFIDKTVTAGNNVYSVVAHNSFGAGTSVCDTIYVGIDAPQSPSQLSFVDYHDGTGLLQWTPVLDVGINGGYVNPELVAYCLTDDSGHVVAENVNGTHFDMSGLFLGAPQQEVTYYVEAKNEAGSSAKTSTEVLLLGEPYHAPYFEGFDNAVYQNGPWRSTTLVGKSYNAKWSPRVDQDQDGNGGSADFQGYLQGGVARLSSPKIDVSQLAKPKLSFWCLFKESGNTNLKLQFSTDFGEWEDVATIGGVGGSSIAPVMKADSKTVSEWTHVEIPLSDFKSQNLRLGFMAECVADFNFVYIDHIEILEDEVTGISDIQSLNDDDDVLVISVNGLVVREGRKDTVNLNNLPSGIYIVKTGNVVKKIAIP